MPASAAAGGDVARGGEGRRGGAVGITPGVDLVGAGEMHDRVSAFERAADVGFAQVDRDVVAAGEGREPLRRRVATDTAHPRSRGGQVTDQAAAQIPSSSGDDDQRQVRLAGSEVVAVPRHRFG